MAKIFITGDKHSNPNIVPFTFSQCKDASPDDYLIICGDFGAEYGNFTSSPFKKKINKFPGKVIILRGNHDNRYWMNHTETTETLSAYIEHPLEGWEFVGDESWEPHFLYQKKYPNIWYTRDEGDIIRINEYNFLFVPGAYSVDKNYRLNNDKPYNPQEQLSYIEMQLLINKLERFLIYDKIDFVISHTFPLSWEPAYRWLFMDGIKQSEVDKTTEEFLDKIEKILDNNYIQWFGGHFHYDMVINEKATMLYNDVVEIGDYIER